MEHIAKVNKIFSFTYKDQFFEAMYRTGKLRDGGERKFTKITLIRIPFPSIYRDGHLDEKEIALVCEELSQLPTPKGTGFPCRIQMNLLSETLDCLTSCGKNQSDVRWVGSTNYGSILLKLQMLNMMGQPRLKQEAQSL